jgi:hypothetical protein
MARRSILSPALQEPAAPEPVSAPPSLEAGEPRPSGIKPSRVAKLHIGGYFDPTDPTVMAFQKLKVDLRRSQQEMLLDAIRDYVAKHEAGRAFR